MIVGIDPNPKILYSFYFGTTGRIFFRPFHARCRLIIYESILFCMTVKIIDKFIAYYNIALTLWRNKKNRNQNFQL